MSILAEVQWGPLLSMPGVKGLVFDLDGTLIDSAADIMGGLREMFVLAGYGQVPDSYVPRNLHSTSEGIMRDIMQDMGWSLPTDFAPLKALYYEVYRGRAHANTCLYPDVERLLNACQSHFTMAICTNKIYRNAMDVTERLGIQSFFSVISGADSWSQAKPSPTPLLETIREMGLAPEQCLYFGDTSVDAECAARAGVRFVLHESGYADAVLASQPRFQSFRRWSELFRDSTESPALQV